jgi:hypothetical protein
MLESISDRELLALASVACTETEASADGVPIAVKDGGEIRVINAAPEERWAVEKALVARTVSPGLRPYLGKGVRG